MEESGREDTYPIIGINKSMAQQITNKTNQIRGDRENFICCCQKNVQDSTDFTVTGQNERKSKDEKTSRNDESSV